MEKIQRTRGIRRAIAARVMTMPAPKYVTAGSMSCSRMMFEARQRRMPGPSDSEILAWARFDLDRELMGGYWRQTA